MVCAEEDLDLLSQECKKVGGCLCGHEVLGNRDLGVSEVESGVAVQLNRADSEICAAQVDSKVETLESWRSQYENCVETGVVLLQGGHPYLLSAIGNASDVCGNLAHTGAILLQAEFYMS